MNRTKLTFGAVIAASALLFTGLSSANAATYGSASTDAAIAQYVAMTTDYAKAVDRMRANATTNYAQAVIDFAEAKANYAKLKTLYTEVTKAIDLTYTSDLATATTVNSNAVSAANNGYTADTTAATNAYNASITGANNAYDAKIAQLTIAYKTAVAALQATFDAVKYKSGVTTAEVSAAQAAYNAGVAQLDIKLATDKETALATKRAAAVSAQSVLDAAKATAVTKRDTALAAAATAITAEKNRLATVKADALRYLATIVPVEPFQPAKPSAPAAVTGLSVDSAAKTTVTVSWDLPADTSITAYKVEVSTNGLTWRSAGSAKGTATSFTVKGLKTKTTYTVRVIARNNAGSGLAATVQAKTA